MMQIGLTSVPNIAVCLQCEATLTFQKCFNPLLAAAEDRLGVPTEAFACIYVLL